MPEKVVISGISGRFPECDDVSSFKEKLYNGGEFVTTDNRKWPVGWKHGMTSDKLIPDATGKLSNVYKLDYSVFRMNKTFARSCDVLNRIILEPTFEAIIDAGVNPYSLNGHNIAVTMAMSHSDVDKNATDPISANLYQAIAGSNKTMLSNRVSFSLNLKGPSSTVYVDPHGGLEALTIASKYVSEGRVEAAIVGAASSILDPRYSLQFTSLGLLSPDGVTRPFDELANGYVRSEAIVCFYLQRAEDAKRSYGELLFSDFTYLGSYLSNFINYDEEYLLKTLQQLHQANPDHLSKVAFVEMNAHGDKVTDEMKSNAVAEILSKNRRSPLLVGSVKSNTGNTEATGGFVALLKALLALDSGTIAPNQHLQKLNENIKAFKQKQLQVVTEKLPLPGDTVAVNTIGLFGTVSLAMIQQHEKSAPVNSDVTTLPRLALICGRQEKELCAKVTQIERLPYNANFISLLNDAFGSHMPHHMYRGFTLLPTPFKPLHDIRESGGENRPVWFIFSGMGSQWPTMGKSLLNLPLFAETVAKCDKVLRGKNIDIYKILTSDDPKLFDDIGNAFVGIITVQIGLYEVIKALGIEPDGIIGHSVGENGCAYADGCLTLEQAVLASWARGVASNEVKTIKGMMAAVGMGYASIKDRLPDDIQVACHNSIDSCTLTGPAESVNTFVESLKNENIFARAVNVANIAYHSKYISELGPKLSHLLEKIIPEPKKRSSKWISTSVEEDKWHSPLAQTCSPEYLTNNLLSPVLFEEGCKHIPANAICIEFAPHGLLQAILKRSFPDTCTNIPLTNRLQSEENLNFFLTAIGKMYIAGLEPRVNNIYPKMEYPVPRETPPLAPFCTWYHQDDPFPNHLKLKFEEEMTMSKEPIPISIREDSEYAYLKDHKINDEIVLPPSLYMYLVWKMISYKRIIEVGSSSVIFENVTVHSEISMTLQDLKNVFVMIQYGSGKFEVRVQATEECDDLELVLSGTISLVSNYVETKPCIFLDDNKNQIIRNSRFYDAYKHAGQNMGEEFALVDDLYRNNSEYKTNITWNGNWVTFLDILMKVQMFVDNDANLVSVQPKSLRRLEIPAAKLSSLEKGTMLPCVLDANTRELFCSGLSMNGLKYKSSPKPQKKLINYQFVSYQDPRCQDLREFLKLCLQIVHESLTSNDGETDRLLILNLARKSKFSQIIEQIIDEEIAINLVEVSHSLRVQQNGNKHTFIIVDAKDELAKLKAHANAEESFILIIFPDSSYTDFNVNEFFVEVTKQSFSKNTFALLKKVSPYILHNHYEIPRSKLEKVIERNFVEVRKDIDSEDVSRLVGVKQNDLDKKYLYVMGKVTDQQLDELKEKQLNFNMPVSVLKHGEWGTYKKIEEKSDPRNSELLPNFRNGSSRIDCICLVDNEVLKTNCTERTLITFAYTGTSKSSEKVMGIATTRSLVEDPVYDPYLFWNMPQHWNSNDAVMVSYTYTQAYYILFSANPFRRQRSVLINVGNEYFLAEALVSLSLRKNLKIFLTVNTDEEAALFATIFPELKSYQILRSHNYDVQILERTRGKGVDTVINCLEGIHHVNASWRCVKVSGFHYEIGMNNCRDLLEIEMYHFLKNVSFCLVMNDASNLLKLSDGAKKSMKAEINEGIDTGMIVPFRVKQRSTSLKILKCQPTNEAYTYRSGVIEYDQNHSYILVGTGAKDNLWLDIAEWLINKGAQKLVVFLDKSAVHSETSERLNQVLGRKYVNISLMSARKLDNKQETASTLNEIRILGPIQAIFFEAIKMIGKKVSNLDELVSPDVPFIGLSSGTLKEFEHRNSKGSPAILVHSDKPRDSLILLPHLDDLLTQEGNNNVTTRILYTVEDLNSRRERTRVHRLQDYLPQDIQTLGTIGQDRSENSTFIEMCSLSSRYCQCKGVYPIFALPAIHSSILSPLFRRLMYPIFSAAISNVESKDEIARKLYQSLTDIQPSGPVTLISETWSLPTTLELVNHLELADRKYRIFILEGNPTNWTSQLHSKAVTAKDADTIFHFATQVSDGKLTSTNSISFEDKIKMYAESLTSDVRIMSDVMEGAKIVLEKMVDAAKRRIKVSNQGLLRDAILFERCRPNDETFNLSTTSKIVVIEEPSYQSLLLNPEVIRMINENAQFSWWRNIPKTNVSENIN